jgi:chemotaxis protein methyltransferase CheR
MGQAVEPALLGRLSEFVCRTMGLNFTPDRWSDLERGIRSAGVEFGFEDPAEFADWLVHSSLAQEQVALLATHLTIGETYFFRESRAFDALREKILPGLIQERRGGSRRLRIWSAGCCTGEEPYSIAILVRQMLPDIEGWNVSILATDINPTFLKRAENGVFSEWSFRGVSPQIREQYFTRVGGSRYEIRPFFRKLVAFNYLNLADESYPSVLNDTNAMDVIFCRNVMIYLSEKQSANIAQRLGRSLVEGGYLIVGTTEASQRWGGELSVQGLAGLTAYRKSTVKTGQIEPSERVAPPVVWLPPEPMDMPVAPAMPLPAAIREAVLPKSPARQPMAIASEHYERGQYAEAAAILEPLASDGDTDISAIVLLARAQANQGKLESARQWCGRAIELDRLNPSWHYLRGTILMESGQWPEARTDFGHALYLDPDFVMAHVALSHLARRRGDFKQAQKHRENALSLIVHCEAESPLPESEGLTAARLAQILSAANSFEEAKT